MRTKLTTIEFVTRAKLVHGDKYDYSNTKYISARNVVNIICNIHGEFNQKPSHHTNGSGCPKCTKNIPTEKEFIEKASLVHSNKYDYSNVKYINTREQILINCPIHGEFEQIARNHLNGCGCPICKQSKGERKITSFLIENNILFIPQHRFNDCRNTLPLPFDFYLPELNTCIEFQGRQHYESVKSFGGEIELKRTQMSDNVKMEYCQNNNIPLITIKYNDKIIEKLQKFL